MTYLLNTAEHFVDEMLAGFAAAHRQRIVAVDGGVIRRDQPQPGQVVVVIGGGSGHYPAFAGLVGQGLVHGAAIGNVFASPSAQQIHNVAQAASAGGGVLFCVANYAGDVLNFSQAQARLREQGINVNMVVVTDDIASAPNTQQHLRRGIAGALPVFKAAGAAADAGKPLDEVCRIATAANERVRTLGVAFSGCTLPGASEPLFSVARGQMEVGMGIHGESGLQRMAAPNADDLAHMLVGKLLDNLPADIEQLAQHEQLEGMRVGVILNSLGSVSHEELFVVYRRVDELLREYGLDIVEPIVDRVITSFDMAGISLTLFWLTDELEQIWRAPAYAPAFKRGTVTRPQNDLAGQTVQVVKSADTQQATVSAGTPASQQAAAVVVAILESARHSIETQQDELGRLDAVAGDGDHGIGMLRGVTAALAAAQTARAAHAGAGTVLMAAGDAWADRAGGTSGALWGVILCNLGSALGDTFRPDATLVAAGVASALQAVMKVGRAQSGDKTLVDVLQPFSTALAQGAVDGLGVVQIWEHGAFIAAHAAQETRDLLPKIGRARPHAEKSIGTPDPGAVSMALIVDVAGQVIRKHCA